MTSKNFNNFKAKDTYHETINATISVNSDPKHLTLMFVGVATPPRNILVLMNSTTVGRNLCMGSVLPDMICETSLTRSTRDKAPAISFKNPVTQSKTHLNKTPRSQLLI